MTVMNKKMASMDMDNMAGLGLSAWSHTELPTVRFVAINPAQSQIVQVDHDARKIWLQQNPERAKIPHYREFVRVADEDGGKENAFVFGPLTGLLLLALAL